MKVKYSPEGGGVREWEFAAAKVRASDAEMVENRWRGHGEPQTFEGWRANLMQGSARAARILLWLLLKRETHTLRFEDVDPLMGEIELDLDLAEMREIRESVSGKRAKTPVEREEKLERLAVLDELIAEEEAAGAVASTDPTTAPSGA